MVDAERRPYASGSQTDEVVKCPFRAFVAPSASRNVLQFCQKVVNGLLMATEVISLEEFHNHTKAGEFYDCYWVKCAIVRVVRNSTGNLMYLACASCFKENNATVKALDFSQTTSTQCCSAPLPSHRCFDRMWLLEIGLSRKNRERTVWTASKPDDTHLYIDNPSIEGLRRQFAEIGTDDASSAAAEHTALTNAIAKLGRLSLAVDDLASATDTLLRDVQQLRDDSRDIRSAIDTLPSHSAISICCSVFRCSSDCLTGFSSYCFKETGAGAVRSHSIGKRE
ncbi:hypothetical protein R1flu_019700 [Riccia fluitans]|uniref:t-SNARE coiled-coil homology domain-containing protein n=1 Tax=Riccia fluitans TaxID=41844 RepID=A0ABD1ZJE4_9MARC